MSLKFHHVAVTPTLLSYPCPLRLRMLPVSLSTYRLIKFTILISLPRCSHPHFNSPHSIPLCICMPFFSQLLPLRLCSFSLSYTKYTTLSILSGFLFLSAPAPPFFSKRSTFPFSEPPCCPSVVCYLAFLNFLSLARSSRQCHSLVTPFPDREISLKIK